MTTRTSVPEAFLLRDAANPNAKPQTAVLVIRGVGDSEPNAELAELIPHLGGHSVLPCLAGELNWSSGVLSPRHSEFTDLLATSWLNCIHVGWPADEGLPRWQARALKISRIVLDMTPMAFLCAGLVVVTCSATATRLTLLFLAFLFVVLPVPPPPSSSTGNLHERVG